MIRILAQVCGLRSSLGGKIILDGISLEVREHEILVILGGSGCGKSTLLKNMIGLYEPSQGEVSLLGGDIRAMDEKELQKTLVNVGVLFQNGALLNSITVGENISIPLKQHTDLPSTIINRLVDMKLNLVELSNAANLFPNELSGGMRKRAALARALALDPQLLFADEPSAGLDPVTSRSLDELFLNLRERLRTTMVIVTHELASIYRIADRIAFLHQGRLLFTGTVAQALKSRIPEISQFFSSGSLPDN